MQCVTTLTSYLLACAMTNDTNNNTSLMESVKQAPLKLRPYVAIEIWLLLLLL